MCVYRGVAEGGGGEARWKRKIKKTSLTYGYNTSMPLSTYFIDYLQRH